MNAPDNRTWDVSWGSNTVKVSAPSKFAAKKRARHEHTIPANARLSIKPADKAAKQHA